MTIWNFVTTFQQPGSYISLQQNYSLFYKHTCAVQSIKAGYWLHPLVDTRAWTACALPNVLQRHGKPKVGRTTQCDELFIASLHDTTASRGRDRGCSGWKDEQMKSKWRGLKGWRGEWREKGWAEHLSQWTLSLLTRLHTFTTPPSHFCPAWTLHI